MDFAKFLKTEKTITCTDPALVQVNLSEFRKQKDYTHLTTHIINEITDAVLQSQSRGVDNCRVVVTAKGFNKKNADLQYAIYIIKLLQSAFVDRLETCYFRDPPQLFVTFWKVVANFVDKDTKKKLQILQGDEVKTLCEFVD